MSNNLLEQAQKLLAGNQGNAGAAAAPAAASTQKIGQKVPQKGNPQKAHQNNQNRKRPADNKNNKQNNHAAKKSDIKNLGKTKDKNTYNPDAKIRFGNDTNPLHTVKKADGEPETLVIKVPFPNEKGCTMAFNSLTSEDAPKKLRVDEFKGTTCEYTQEKDFLVATIIGTCPKALRAAAAAFFEQLSLIEHTLAQFEKDIREQQKALIEKRKAMKGGKPGQKPAAGGASALKMWFGKMVEKMMMENKWKNRVLVE